MRSIEDKGYNRGQGQDQSSISSSGSGLISFEFHKGDNISNVGASRGNLASSHRNHHNHNRNHHHRRGLGKSTPSKWDDAQKWLVGLSRGGEKMAKSQSKSSKPRNSNADDLRLIAPVPQKEQDQYSSEEEEEEEEEEENGNNVDVDVETKNVDGQESIWRVNKPVVMENNNMSNNNAVVRSICVRDMGTEMTPIASQEPSRTTTPLRATTPVARSPISSGSSTPMRCQHRGSVEGQHACGGEACGRGNSSNNGSSTRRYVEELSGDCKGKNEKSESSDQGANKLNPLETRAVAWDEAERAKYMARYKREEVKIQAWENHEKRKAEMEMRKMEVKAERIKARAEEKLANKLAATRRIAEEKRANAEAELNEKALRTSERADYIRRTGHLPSSFSFKLPSLCW